MIRLAPRSWDGRPRRAFTLVELVMVLLIVATLAAIAIPRYANSATRYRAETAARRIVADLALARSTAYTSGSTVTVNFDVSNNTLSIPGVSGLDKASLDYLVDFNKRPYRADLISADFGGSPAVSFDGYGVPDSGGSVVVGVGLIQKAVALDPDTGQATVQ
ncbi:MAG TPA: GspH/FimT family pseudopilin [Phycisphaerae bacterium]|nr:GspH/FimT family pseudopilin [Phycisphaerae bacterium]